MDLLAVQRDLHSEAYLRERKAAVAEANAEKYFTQGDTSLLVQRHDALNRAHDVTRVEKHQKIGKEEFESRRQELEGTLFEMFKERERWKAKDVAVRSTYAEASSCCACRYLLRHWALPANHGDRQREFTHTQCLKLVCVQRSLELSHPNATLLLNGIADKVKSGPARGEWVLKPAYRQPEEATPMQT
jgi:hypothetical protein